MATPANHNREISQPTCHNCSTSTTPLWRRDEFGSVLCNACGLFLKLHNRPRPISLKTDVIKSRNRVKNAGMRPDLAKKKQQQVQPQPFPNTVDANGLDVQSTAAAATAQAARRSSQKSTNGSGSPVSRTGTPSLYTAGGLPGFPSIQDPSLASSLAAYGSTGRAPSPLNGDRPRDSTPPTAEQLLATNSSLHTRVGELELINKLYSDRVQQLELSDASAKHEQELSRQEVAQLRADLEAKSKMETQLREQLDDSHRRENSLKRRLDELEIELDAKTAAIAAASAAATAAAATAIVTDSVPIQSPAPAPATTSEIEPDIEQESEHRGSPPPKKAKLSDEQSEGPGS
ncbi:hypothetical protein jhhlp_003711 [Lomentospora prolificans]|uniref:GATA-type domain-containing protein n=1 Tax=Lomentospora prolificans TaxID=41688 RepID=A0A2N3N9L5_9PEZI|nr:hypothetical protein jhhlp_003711 [Lomentospora prolificans]